VSTAHPGYPAVVISGMGAVSPLACDLPSTFNALVAAQSGVTAAPAFITQHLPDALAAPVPVAFAKEVPPKESALDRSVQLALRAAREALADANFDPPEAQRSRVGVYVGTGLGGHTTTEDAHRRLFMRLAGVEAGSAMAVNPLTVPRTMPHAPAAWLAIEHRFRGPSLTFSVACASSAVALGEAARAIQHGYADAVLVVGTESLLTLGSYAAWHALRVVAKPDAHDAARSCKPFDAARSGFVLGEGAAAILLERGDLATARGHKGHGRLVGYGISTDAHHITLPQREGQVAALRMALNHAQGAGVKPSDVGYVNAHGTATAAGDVVEIASLREAFGAHADALLVSATKSMHGHLVGAAGAMELAIAVKAMNSGTVPPTAHLEQPDPACDLDCVPGQARRGLPLRAVMSNSFAFGGTNVSLIAST
jgi:3-oxoacyl-[acyl-carrier-protein] synthase II